MRWPAVAGRTLRDSGSSGSEAMTESVGRDFVEFAHLLADAAGGIVVPAIRSRRVVHRKADASPVTEIDRAVETRLREMIAARFPDHGVLGEEFGGERLDAEHVWVLDPVDGTKAFMAGLPVYGTLIGPRPARTPGARRRRPAGHARALDGHRRRRSPAKR